MCREDVVNNARLAKAHARGIDRGRQASRPRQAAKCNLFGVDERKRRSGGRKGPTKRASLIQLA